MQIFFDAGYMPIVGIENLERIPVDTAFLLVFAAEVCDIIHNLAMLALVSVTHSNLLLDTTML